MSSTHSSGSRIDHRARMSLPGMEMSSNSTAGHRNVTTRPADIVFHTKKNCYRPYNLSATPLACDVAVLFTRPPGLRNRVASHHGSFPDVLLVHVVASSLPQSEQLPVSWDAQVVRLLQMYEHHTCVYTCVHFTYKIYYLCVVGLQTPLILRRFQLE